MSVSVLKKSVIDAYLSPRCKNAHKGLYGHVVVLGGDYGMPGAVRIAAEGALRVGAGRVSVVTRPEHVSCVMSGRAELLCYGFDDDLTVIKQVLCTATMIVIGPGLGRSIWSKSLFDAVSDVNVPVLLDADAFYWLKCTAHHAFAYPSYILTPHPGEAAYLLDISAADVQADRVQAIQQLQSLYAGGVMVLKGAQTLLLSPSGELRRCDAGNPGMATAGMGDLLSGMIAGFMVQGLSAWEAAQTGVLTHALAGDCVAQQQGERGMLVSDLLPKLAGLINPSVNVDRK